MEGRRETEVGTEFPKLFKPGDVQLVFAPFEWRKNGNCSTMKNITCSISDSCAFHWLLNIPVLKSNTDINPLEKPAATHVPVSLTQRHLTLPANESQIQYSFLNPSQEILETKHC